jgi:uncharacterized caspase-like protein
LVKLQEGGLYEKVIVKSLVNAEATKDNVLDGLEWLQKQTTSKDVALIFFAGHGVTEGGQYYLLPVNADWEAMKRTALTKADFLSTVEAVPGKVVVFLDACHSGKLSARGGKTRSLDINSIVNELSSAENGAVVFSSCVSRQESMEDAKWSNGAFTEALLEGIKGKADAQNKGVITVKMLDYYVCERVKVLTQGKQAPCSENPLADFPLFIVK